MLNVKSVYSQGYNSIYCIENNNCNNRIIDEHLLEFDGAHFPGKLQFSLTYFKFASNSQQQNLLFQSGLENVVNELQYLNLTLFIAFYLTCLTHWMVHVQLACQYIIGVLECVLSLWLKMSLFFFSYHVRRVPVKCGKKYLRSKG